MAEHTLTVPHSIQSHSNQGRPQTKTSRAVLLATPIYIAQSGKEKLEEKAGKRQGKRRKESEGKKPYEP